MSKCLQQTSLLDRQLAYLLYCENVTVIIVKPRLPEAVPKPISILLQLIGLQN